MLKSVGGEAIAKISKTATCIFLRIAMGIHLGINAGSTATAAYSLVPHTITSIVFFGLLIFFFQTGLFPFVGTLIQQDLFSESFKFQSLLMIAHVAVSAIFLVIHFFVESIEDEAERTNTQITLQNVFNIISSVVCSIIFFLCFLSHKTSIGMESFLSSKKTDTTSTNTGANSKPSEKTSTTTTVDTTNTTAQADVDPNKKEFGKRQRRRNPRRKRY